VRRRVLDRLAHVDEDAAFLEDLVCLLGGDIVEPVVLVEGAKL
jgi:hypothetical protein